MKQLINKDRYVNDIVKTKFNIKETECSICMCNYSDDKVRPLYLSCDCLISFCEECITRFMKEKGMLAINLECSNFSCPQCSKRDLSISEVKGNITNMSEYEKLYDYAKGKLDNIEFLKFLSNWHFYIKRRLSRFNRSCIIEYVPEYYSYTKYNKNSDDIKLFPSGNYNYTVLTHVPFYTANEVTTLNNEEFIDVFNKLSMNIFKDFDWNNVICAGGMVSKIMQRAYTEYPESSDFDLFIFSDSDRVRTEKILYILNYFYKKNTGNVYFAVKRSVINIYIRGFNRVIQLICGAYHKIDEILYGFDLTHVQIGFSNGKLYCTPQYLESCKFQLTVVNKEQFKLNRVLKTIGTGYNLLSEEKVDKIINIIKPRNTFAYYPTESESEETIIEMICDVNNLNKQSVTTDPNKASIITNDEVKLHSYTGATDITCVIDPQQFVNFSNMKYERNPYALQNTYDIQTFQSNILKNMYFQVENVNITKLSEVTSEACTIAELTTIFGSSEIMDFCSKIRTYFSKKNGMYYDIENVKNIKLLYVAIGRSTSTFYKNNIRLSSLEGAGNLVNSKKNKLYH